MKAHLTFTVIAPHPPNWFVIWELYSKLSLIKLKFMSKEPFTLLLFLFKKEMFLFEVGKYWSCVSYLCVLQCVQIDLCKACTSTKSTKMLYGSLWGFLFVCLFVENTVFSHARHVNYTFPSLHSSQSPASLL